MKSKHKAKLITALICALLMLLMYDLVALWPKALPWILGLFAIPGGLKFARTLYIWLITEDTPIEIKLPWSKKTRATKRQG